MIVQRTLDHSIRCSGIGLHSGRKIQLVLHPAAEDTGITFVRSDLGVEIPAKAEFVTDTRLCTTIGHEKAQISTIEHLLSAFAGLGVDNARIEVSGPEVPIMDGSSAPFVFLIQCAGVREQSKAKKVLRVLKRVEVEEGDKRCALYPAGGFKISYLLDYDHPLLRKRKVAIDFAHQAYTREISRARTFGFLHEVEAMRSAGLARGGSLDNAVVLSGDEVMNEEGLRYEDEFVRHKILDALGDLYTAGLQLQGKVTAYKSGHHVNNLLLQALLADETAYQVTPMRKAALNGMVEPSLATA